MGSNAMPTVTQWRKSSYSGDQGGQCLEIAELPCPAPALVIRDSKTPAGPILTLGPAAFTSFVDWAATTAG
ncbi:MULTISPECIES: DUF397 domain-containing protein [unclassified Streptomyces]|uniref:DUF397 domain-containing protein n=1 Tax=unclassified Streptomyces TaxID=2593676 RepID=UPI00403C3C5C